MPVITERNMRRGILLADRLWTNRDSMYLPELPDETLTDQQLHYVTSNFLYKRAMRRTDIPHPDDPMVAWITGRTELTVERGRRNGSPNSGGPVVRTGRCCGVWCRAGRLKGRRCHRPAGDGTAHYGAGPCAAHDGNRPAERALGAMLMGHAFAEQLDVDPWEALLMAVRISAGKVAYIESVLSTARSDAELEGRPDGQLPAGEGLRSPDTGAALPDESGFRDLSWWVTKGEWWHGQMARCAKMAVDAGIQAYLAERVEGDALAVARVLERVVGELELSDEQEDRVRSAMREELLRLGGGSGLVEGAVVD